MFYGFASMPKMNFQASEIASGAYKFEFFPAKHSRIIIQFQNLFRIQSKNTAPVSFREIGSCPAIYTASIVGPSSPTPCSILFSFRLTCLAVLDAHPANRDMFCILSDFHPAEQLLFRLFWLDQISTNLSQASLSGKAGATMF